MGDQDNIREALAGNLDDAALLETTQSAVHSYCMSGNDGDEEWQTYNQIRAAIGEATFDGYVGDDPTLFGLIDSEMSRADCLRVLAILSWPEGVAGKALLAAAGLIRAGTLDEAERAARDLLVRFPDSPVTGYQCLGMVYVARGDKKRAADYYRLALAYIRRHSLEATLERHIARLDPPAS
jgi:hypothetical protein